MPGWGRTAAQRAARPGRLSSVRFALLATVVAADVVTPALPLPDRA